MEKVMADPATTRLTWELLNEVKEAEKDMYFTDMTEQEQILQTKPWRTDPHYFKKVLISASALIKMVIHARSGGTLEIMGLMQGRIRSNVFVITSAFALPVEGTETRVNAGAEATEYMINFQSAGERIGRMDNICGWYHSHPSYRCWLSGIDVQTQLLYQTHQEPFVAIVIDPTTTCATGKIDLGAFRTWPAGFAGDRTCSFTDTSSSAGIVPLDKSADFGSHWREYYQLEVEVYKSSADTRLLDQLWASHRTAALAASPLISNARFFAALGKDLKEKVRTLDSRSDAFDTALKLSGLLTDELTAAASAQRLKVSLFGGREPKLQIGGAAAAPEEEGNDNEIKICSSSK